MKTSKHFIYLLVISSCCFCNLHAQSKKDNKKEEDKATKKAQPKLFSNSLKILWGDYSIRNTDHNNGGPILHRCPYIQVGAYYERKVYKHWFASIGFMEWNALWNGFAPWQKETFNAKVTLNEENSFVVAQTNYKPIVNGLEYRNRYKMADFYAFYKYQIGRSSHFINLGFGVSYNWGMNSYLLSYSANPEPPYDSQGFYYSRAASYWGIIPQVSYDYWFYKNRFNIGAGYRARYYPERIKVQHDFDIHTGVNF